MINRPTKYAFAVAVAVAALLGAPLAHALVIDTGGGTGGGGGGTTNSPPPATISTTMQLGTVYTGAIADGTGPWLTATFTATSGAASGILTLTSNLSDSDFLQGLSSSNSNLGWGFYLPDVTSLTGLSCQSGTCANNQLFGGDYNSGPVPGGFNLAFGWSSTNRFMSGSTATYQLSFSSGLLTSPFGANSSGWTSVAHVQGITGGCSGWIVSGDGTGAQGGTACVPTTGVPEPGALGIFSLGLLVVTAVLLEERRRRRTKRRPQN